MNAALRCDEVQQYLAERLAGRLSDRLSSTVHSLVRTHMLSCPECCDELEDFEEMEAVLRTIPLEPCDSTAMRARFDLLMRAREEEAKGFRPPAIRSWSLRRPIKIILSVLAAFVVLVAAFLAVRRGRTWIPAEKAASTVPAQTSEPATAPVPIVSAGKLAPPAVISELTNVSGRVLMEDGSELSDPLPLGEIALTSAGSSSGNSTIVVKLDNSGRFSQTIAADEYRFRVAVFSQNYIIRSISSGAADLLIDNLKASGDSPVAVEIRVTRKVDTGIGTILGTVVDAVTNSPSQTDLVALCCFPSGPAERISAAVRSDGTFEFMGVPSGLYVAELRGGRNLVVANPTVRMTSAGVSGLKLFSATELVQVDVNVRLDSGERLPYNPDTSIVFTGTIGTFRVAASGVVGNLFRVTLPVNVSYAVAVSNTAAGYSIQSIVDQGKSDLMHGGFFMATSSPAAPPRIDVTLTKN